MHMLWSCLYDLIWCYYVASKCLLDALVAPLYIYPGSLFARTYMRSSSLNRMSQNRKTRMFNTTVQHNNTILNHRDKTIAYA
jgi:hypothetical protein